MRITAHRTPRSLSGLDEMILPILVFSFVNWLSPIDRSFVNTLEVLFCSTASLLSSVLKRHRLDSTDFEICLLSCQYLHESSDDCKLIILISSMGSLRQSRVLKFKLKRPTSYGICWCLTECKLQSESVQLDIEIQCACYHLMITSSFSCTDYRY